MKATVKITLNETLEKSKITRNAIAQEGKIRPATISELCNGQSKALSFKTLIGIVNALNAIDKDGKLYGIQYILTIEYDHEEES